VKGVTAKDKAAQGNPVKLFPEILSQRQISPEARWFNGEGLRLRDRIELSQWRGITDGGTVALWEMTRPMMEDGGHRRMAS